MLYATCVTPSERSVCFLHSITINKLLLELCQRLRKSHFPFYSSHQFCHALVTRVPPYALSFHTRKVLWDGYRKGRLWIVITSHGPFIDIQGPPPQPWNICCKTEALDHSAISPQLWGTKLNSDSLIALPTYFLSFIALNLSLKTCPFYTSV